MKEYKEYSSKYAQLEQERRELSKKMSAVREILLTYMKPDQKRLEGEVGYFSRYTQYSPWKYSKDVQELMKAEQDNGTATREAKNTLRLYSKKD